MNVKTRDFGEVEIDEKDIITFRQPIYGFEDLTRYVLLQDAEMNGQFVWMQSVEEPALCFIMVDPDILAVEYRPHFPDNLHELLGEDDCICWCLLAIPERFEDATVNLKSPILINPVQKCAAQVILEEDYSLRQPLMPREEGKPKC